MTDIAETRSLTPLDGRVSAFRSALAAYRQSRDVYRVKRAIYLRTLSELQSYRPRELNDLRIDPADFHALAREQAGW